MIEQFARQRAYFLRAALTEAAKWCEPPDQLVEGKRSDQFWLRVFSSPSGPLAAEHVRNFLVAYRLVRQGQWDHQALAARIVSFRGSDGSEIVDVVRSLAGLLSKSVSRREGGNRQQTSAASKVCFFMRPLHDVYIWDKLATISARFRDWHRAGGGSNPPRFSRSYTSANREHDYALYCAACARVLAEERACHDFVAAVSRFREFLREVGGPMGTQPVLSSSFVERRFLDKLMWSEGLWIMAWQGKRGEEVPSSSETA